MKTKQSGFTLLVAVIFMSVMLAFGLALGSLAYKQQVLASSAIESQYAFYAADAGLECALYADQRQNLFTYPATRPPSAPGMVCDGQSATFLSSAPDGIPLYNSSKWVVTERFSLDSSTSNPRCADVTIHKPNGSGPTYIFSLGYDVPCTTVESILNGSLTGARMSARGINVHY